ncbi:MAG: biosynthetic-type acetolactate synthase large subunit [Alphaproteobacteria bacterium]|nr:biosynthetic-type acetolactate synthase large subunit [Alphaproteobacteria bacterium]
MSEATGQEDQILKADNLFISGAEMAMKALAEHKVQHVFGYPGGAALPLYDALFQQTAVYHTLVSHEQGAVHAAEGYARSTGEVGCVLVTSGPGATNTVTGLMDAYADSVPLVVISGQVVSTLIGTDAFQECDVVGITRPCTKRNYLATDIADLPRILHEAFFIAKNGRPGPVLIDIPKDVQNAKGIYRAAHEFAFTDARSRAKPRDRTGDFKFTDAAIEQAESMMREAKRPVFYIGGGVINSGIEACEALRELARATGFPVTSTLMGLGAYPASDAQWLGMLGMHGTYEANKAMHEADLILAIGARFDDRVTGRVDKFAPQARKIHVDIDPSSINKIVQVDVGIAADCRKALAAMLCAWRRQSESGKAEDLSVWWQIIDLWRREDSLAFEESDSVIKPQQALQKLARLIKGKDARIVTDVGQHQMWAAQHLRIEKPHRWMTSGGLGTMGYGLPASIGVQTAHPDALVVCISGDGSLQMNSQEMATAVQENLPIKILLLNNAALGMVRQWQELCHGKRYAASKGKAQPDFVKLAEAYGWRGSRCVAPQLLDKALRELIKTVGPCLLDCRVDANENCYPMIPAGNGHDEMIWGSASV